ncbi:hypothetical protein [Dactylosporangium matsuzakiense]|uniref:Uncharacterized protein n=1 Tax=Dactylosporangium matsuzakiense TaxID=53360 RepID=A0A9W6KXC3_9ACTN|nr:hypothetical protein [Dactylosporangium matsuzakiense]UWZ46407.1 hypothetical protein Dmats_08275 [Dactylosporangium matsuzakiense]GLL07179.1 hypothetical protein GCM10017581_089310 [Dactylosporangium matsuzakiense]
MGVKEHLTEPWGLVAAGVLGGMGGAVAAALAPAGLLVGVPVGLAVAGAVYGIRVGLGVITDRDGAPDLALKAAPPATLPTPPRGSDAERFLRRAEAAVRTLRRQAEGTGDPLLRSQVSEVDDSAAGALADLARFAGQVTLIEQTAAGINTQRLRQEYSQIQRGLSGLEPGPLRDERERARRALSDQLDVGQRLRDAKEMLLARMQSAVLGLEGLVARMAELVALHATTVGGAPLTAAKVAELTNDLEGLRAGLAEAERLSRSALSGGDDPGSLP